MGIKERYTIKRLDERLKEKIDLEYYNTVYQFNFEKLDDVPSIFKEAHCHFNRSNRLIFLCHHLKEFKRLSWQQIANRYGITITQARTFVDSYNEMKSLEIV